MRLDQNHQAFFCLVKAGIWEQDVQLSSFEKMDFNEVYRISEEQSVIGLVAAGLEHVVDMKVLKKDAVPFIGKTFQMEQRNLRMNHYITTLIEQMRHANIYAVLVKGQGTAQCYERPLWRSSGDIDLLLSADNYEKAKKLLKPLAESIDTEFKEFKHLGVTMGEWVVELHGTLHCRLSKKIDKEIDAIQDRVFRFGEVRVWRNEDMDVFLPTPDNDVIFLFTHILKHFYQGGIGLRQICDLCRFLWTYRDSLDKALLERRLINMRILPEWMSFAAYLVDWLGMPADAVPLYSPGKKWSRKAQAINRFVLKMGNFGRNRDNDISNNYPFLVKKSIAFWHRTSDCLRHMFVFPINSVKTWWTILVTGVRLL